MADLIENTFDEEADYDELREKDSVKKIFLKW